MRKAIPSLIFFAQVLALVERKTLRVARVAVIEDAAEMLDFLADELVILLGCFDYSIKYLQRVSQVLLIFLKLLNF